MGLFASRPEEPQEWAGLPAEPLDPAGEAELLREAPTLDGAGLGLGGLGSLPIPVSPRPDGGEPLDGAGAEGQAGDAPAEGGPAD